MSAADGHVVGVTKLVDNGPDTKRWNLVIIGDGYQEGELGTYHAHAEKFVHRLQTTPPFDEMFAGINVHRIDVVSRESGADDPGCAGGPAVARKTYFDATFCSPHNGHPIDRLLTVDNALALSVTTAGVPQKHYVVCIVNSTKYGGSGGAIATCSVHATSAKIAIHELGHSAFGLADEYGGNGNDTPAESLRNRMSRATPTWPPTSGARWWRWVRRCRHNATRAAPGPGCVFPSGNFHQPRGRWAPMKARCGRTAASIGPRMPVI